MIESLDQEILLAFNASNSSFWDYFWLFFTDKITGTLFIGIFMLFMWKKSNFKTAFIIGVFVVVSVIFTDLLATLVKNVVARPRPCSINSEIADQIRLLADGLFKGKMIDSNAVKCEKYSFFSAHAAVAFAMASFLGKLLNRIHKAYFGVMLIWAFLVSISRIYLGFHYPSDIIVGSIFGFGVGILVYEFYDKIQIAFLKNYRFNPNK
ncbi:phosphatase PAP2 family protein [Psychroflexus planctonicus]|uniref:Lipid A 4'-phosphatase n=1 Tax=Psychroflexus planctonicus TaxID=1526575 RepID=A0ABQ1SHJ8_9FLAO|nr:phosphatase PAP2 family protein [Psychroflexus planctonicus]GGE36326.1 lipid A 4'-phosphatase [Psychroflexus planctonicus]